MPNSGIQTIAKTFQVNSLSEFLEAIEESRDVLGIFGELWFRGHATNKWTLLPSIYRNVPKIFLEDDSFFGSITRERTYFVKFQSAAYSRSTGLPDQDNISQWLCLMRHYGLPTRLMDWSASPLVAAFFALSNLKFKTPHIWVLSPTILNKQQDTVAPTLILRDKTPDPLLKNHLLDIENDSITEKSILAVEPPEVDNRLLAQRAKFTIHGTHIPLNNFSLSKPFLCKINIGNKGIFEIQKALKLFGYNQSTIFPDLDHLALELAENFGLFGSNKLF